MADEVAKVKESGSKGMEFWDNEKSSNGKSGEER